MYYNIKTQFRNSNFNFFFYPEMILLLTYICSRKGKITQDLSIRRIRNDFHLNAQFPIPNEIENCKYARKKYLLGSVLNFAFVSETILTLTKLPV